MPPPLPGPLAHLAPLLDDYGYPAVGLLVFLDNCLVPVPGQTILILAAVYAGAGRMSIAAVMAVGFVAAFLGNSLAYRIGRTGGHAFVLRWGRYLRLTPERMDRAHSFFTRHGGKVVTGARFVDGLRQTNGLVAGTTEMPWPRFLVANAAGAALWTGVWTTIGFLAGNNIDELYRQAVRYQVLLLVVVAAVALAVLTRTLLRRRIRRRAAAAAEQEAAPEAGPGAAAESGAGTRTADEPGSGPENGSDPGPDSDAGPAPGPARGSDPGQPRNGMTSNDDA